VGDLGIPLRALAVALLLLASPAVAQVRVVDGDTIRVGAARVRIFGLDCPEMRDPGGREAKRMLERLLAGKTLSLQRIERDRYGRTVARVFASGQDVTCAMIRAGACREYVRYSGSVYAQCSK